MWQASVSWDKALFFVLLAVFAVFFILFRYVGKEKNNFLQSIMFCTSFLILFLLAGSPLNTWSHLSFSTHMLQMSLLYFLVPPLFLFGVPRKLLQKWNGLYRKQVIIPRIALIAFSILFFLYHLPPLLAFLIQSPILHTFLTWLLFIMAIFMWLPMIHFNQRDTRKKFASLSSMLLMPACLLFVVNGLIHQSTTSPFMDQLIVKLCISPEQMDVLLPFHIDTRIDQIAGGLFMLGLHKLCLLLALHLGERKGRDIHFTMRKPSLRIGE
ncbi:cytochrome c oxidase assembly protein [Siminovitchia sediminis]|uniref:Cytochrome c oxidase assembly protein n=1 Tax=Siminovitchia sediminis TaxID=1274353 RepID=A0ABW4KH53_9BACI